MKISLLLLSFCFCFTSFAKELHLHFPKENGSMFLATTAKESAKQLDKATREARGLEICKYYGYQKVVDVDSTYFALESITLNEVIDGELRSKEFKKDFSNLYYYDHAVIGKLVCSDDLDEEHAARVSINDVGREIAIEKEDRIKYLKKFSSSSSKQ